MFSERRAWKSRTWCLDEPHTRFDATQEIDVVLLMDTGVRGVQRNVINNIVAAAWRLSRHSVTRLPQFSRRNRKEFYGNWRVFDSGCSEIPDLSTFRVPSRLWRTREKNRRLIAIAIAVGVIVKSRRDYASRCIAKYLDVKGVNHQRVLSRKLEREKIYLASRPLRLIIIIRRKINAYSQ